MPLELNEYSTTSEKVKGFLTAIIITSTSRSFTTLHHYQMPRFMVPVRAPRCIFRRYSSVFKSKQGFHQRRYQHVFNTLRPWRGTLLSYLACYLRNIMPLKCRHTRHKTLDLLYQLFSTSKGVIGTGQRLVLPRQVTSFLGKFDMSYPCCLSLQVSQTSRRQQIRHVNLGLNLLMRSSSRPLRFPFPNFVLLGSIGISIQDAHNIFTNDR